MDPAALDAIKLNFNPQSLVALNVLIGLMMLGMALDIKLDDFRRVVVSPRGPARLRPSSTALRVAMMASSTMALPEVLAVISRPSRIGTPDAVKVPRVRQNRATAIFSSS